MEIKTSKDVPPIFSRLQATFGVRFKDIIIAYDDTIYCSEEIPPSYLAHEIIHLEQQSEMGVEKWWDKYITDKIFRLDQEIAAYRAQIRFLARNPKEMGKSSLSNYIHNFASFLSGPTYGNMISYISALARLRN